MDDQHEGGRARRLHRAGLGHQWPDFHRRSASEGSGHGGFPGAAEPGGGLPAVPFGARHSWLRGAAPGRAGAHRAEHGGAPGRRRWRRPRRAGQPGDAGDPGPADLGGGADPDDPSAGPGPRPSRGGTLGQCADRQRPARQHRAHRVDRAQPRPGRRARLQHLRPAPCLGRGNRRGARPKRHPGRRKERRHRPGPSPTVAATAWSCSARHRRGPGCCAWRSRWTCHRRARPTAG